MPVGLRLDKTMGGMALVPMLLFLRPSMAGSAWDDRGRKKGCSMGRSSNGLLGQFLRRRPFSKASYLASTHMMAEKGNVQEADHFKMAS